MLSSGRYTGDMDFDKEAILKRFAIVSTRKSERGDMLKIFSEKTGKPIRYIAFRLTGIPTSDLYFIDKQCEAYKGPYGKAFFGMLKKRVDN